LVQKRFEVESAEMEQSQGKTVYNGLFNRDEKKKAAHASDILARELMTNGEKEHKLNFPNDETELWAEKEPSSKYVGVSLEKSTSKWKVWRRSKVQGKNVFGGSFNRDEEIKAAHASDTLARALNESGEIEYKLNFPNDETEVWAEKETSSKYLGVSWGKRKSKWRVCRWSKIQGKMVYNGSFNRGEEIKAARASDVLGVELMNNGEKGHKLNFLDNPSDACSKKTNKRKRKDDLEPKTIEIVRGQKV